MARNMYYNYTEDNIIDKTDESLKEDRIKILWEDAPKSIRDNLSSTLAALCGNRELIKKTTGNLWTIDKNSFFIKQLWNKKKKTGLLGHWESKLVEWSDKQEKKSLENLWENYIAVCSNKEVQELKNMQMWLMDKENLYSYERDIDYVNSTNRTEKYIKGDKSLKKNMLNFQIDNIMFNHIFEHIIRDLIEDIINLKLSKEEIKIIKTNEYDDVNSKTDYIIEANLGKGKFGFKMIDITTISNEEELRRKEEKSHKPILFDYSTVKKNIISGTRDVRSIDKNFAFNLVNNYINVIKKGKKFESGQCLELAKKISESSMENISRNISESLSRLINN